jgi:hypothetical protein
MSESEEHKQLKGLFEIILGQRECKVNRGRVDACNNRVTAEIECSKTGEQRVCRVDFRHQPDTKNVSIERSAPFETLYFSHNEIRKIGNVIRESGIHFKQKST